MAKMTGSTNTKRIQSARKEGKKDLYCVYEIWYKASHYRDDQPHPQAINQLVLIEGIKDRTVVSRPSPDQTFDQTGMLTTDSLVGFPIVFGYLRVLADSPFPRADSAFTNAGAKELNTYRRQSVKLRDAAIAKYLLDSDWLDEEEKKQLQSGEHEFIFLKAGALAQGADKVITPVAQLKATLDDYKGSEILKQDINETLGISSVEAGAELDTVRSATEIKKFSSGSSGRQRKERDRAIAFYLKIVRGIDTLIARYAQGADYVAIAGDDGTKKVIQWNAKIMNVRCSYSIQPDSQLHIDTAVMRQQRLTFYSLIAPDPLANRAPVIKDLYRDFGYDPNIAVLDPMQAMGQMPYSKGTGAAGDKGGKHEQEKSGGTPNEPGASTREDRTGKPPEGSKP